MTLTSFTRRDILSLLIILLLAAFMRFGRAGIVEYFHDDGMLATLVQEMARGQTFPVTGINSSTGIPNPPTSVYALLPFFWISHDPVFAIFGIMALNVIGVGLLWIITHRYFGRSVAIVAGLAYALNPWAVLYSRKLWAQDYHTPFFLLGLLLALYGFMEGDSRPPLKTGRFWAQMACLPILLFAMQIHFAAWALFPLYLMLLWMGRRRIAWKALLLSVILGAVTLLPYSIGLVQTLQRDPTRISAAVGRSQERPGGLSVESPLYTLGLITGEGLRDAMVVFDPDSDNKGLFDQFPTQPISGLIIFVIVAYSLGILLRRQHPLTGWLLWWGFAPTILLLSNFTRVYPHYFIASIPAYTLLIACFALPRLPQAHEKPKMRPSWLRPRAVIMGALGAALILQARDWLSALDYVDAHHIPYPGFTTPLHILLDIRDALKEETDVVVLSEGMAWDLNHEVSVWDTLLYDKTCVRTLRDDGYAVLPDHPFGVVVASNARSGRVLDFYSVGTPRLFPERPSGGAYKVYHWEAAPTWPTPITSIPPVRFSNGVELVGLHVDTPTVTLAWHLPQGQRGENVQYTVQFFDAQDNRVGQGDKVFWQSQHWCAGDTLLTWLDVPREGSNLTMRVGLYSLLGEGQYRPIPVLDASGQAAGDTTEIVQP